MSNSEQSSPRKTVVVLTGAGISKESGISTFRDSDGLWRGIDYMEVASSKAWKANPGRLLEHYNERREIAWKAQPNAGHMALAQLEEHYDVHIVTQNIDRLHERAGSSNILHLHGDLHQSRSDGDRSRLYEQEGRPIQLGDTGDDGGQLRPNIVLFGEDVPMMTSAVQIAMHADYFIVVGTSLVVYPAASLLAYVPPEAPIYVVDPGSPSLQAAGREVHRIPKSATAGVPPLVEELIEKAQ